MGSNTSFGLVSEATYSSGDMRHLGNEDLLERPIEDPEVITTPCLKNQSKFFSSVLRQTSANLDNFWHKDGQDDEIM